MQSELTLDIQQGLVSGVSVNVSGLWSAPTCGHNLTSEVTAESVQVLTSILAANASSLRKTEAVFHLLLATELGTMLGPPVLPIAQT